MDKSLQAHDSLAGLSLQSLDSSSPSIESTELPSGVLVTAIPIGSYPILTRAKAGIFKPHHPANLAVLGSSGLLSALLASTSLKGSNQLPRILLGLPPWMKKFKLCKNNRTWILVPRYANTNIVGSMRCTDTSLFIFHSFTRKLHSEFATKDLGSLSNFFSLEATPTTDGLFLTQLKYARGTLSRAQLLDSKPVHTSMVVSQHLSYDGSLFSNLTLYQSLVVLHSPTDDHILAVKRILRYVKGTLHFGLSFHQSVFSGTLVAYSDADYAGCPDTRLSTSGYSIYLGDNLVSWSAKKQPTVSRSNCESE
ncbi:uncharacterized mitochondrial protein AtMg00810-like [Hibiscus syriacus]|uniref:uncharacterized mitochondrial protein AtMg00810-like n=1 Tax=Hibiscus syriacus TaxID=106335 RepID=UPI0019250F4F|nr:uncharacterized mitochondrial protein AtMg00810-like [Hibiscus syriacus]